MMKEREVLVRAQTIVNLAQGLVTLAESETHPLSEYLGDLSVIVATAEEIADIAKEMQS